MTDYSLQAQSGNTPLGKLSLLPPSGFQKNRRQAPDSQRLLLGHSISLGQGGGEDV
jgi:hypothetical protein